MAQADKPQLLPDQFEAVKVGDLGKQVNMFRGDLILPHSLFTLPGKPDDSAYQVEFTLTYQSNVNQQVGQWNRDAPTSVLGAGWSMPEDRIEMSSGSGLGCGARSYTLVQNGVGNQLVPIAPGQPVPTRAQLGAAVLADLAPGTVASSVVAAFLSQGLALGASATVAGTGPWTICDPENQRDFAVAASGAVTDGGVSFQAHSYEFWIIVYYANYERWEITTETGERRLYGGGLGKTADGFMTSFNNSIGWSVAWTAPSGAAGWAGPSSTIEGQVQYASSWSLAARVNPWGGAVNYLYNGFGRDAATGIITRGAEQLVGGAGGLPYTKALYLTSIVGITGHTATFTYGDKSYTADVMEYMDPHKTLAPAAAAETPPANVTAPNGYQDRYETLYLSGAALSGPDGTALASFALGYLPPQAIPGFQGALATGAKRYLSTITEINRFGQALPPYAFGYALGGGSVANPGALVSLTYPQGSVATWTYGQVQATACDRSLTIGIPSTLSGDSNRPLVWFGPDYCVVLWLNGNATAADLTVYSWAGQWIAEPLGLVYDNADIAIAMQGGAPSISVQLGASCGCLVIETHDQQFLPVLIGRNSGTPSRWTLDASRSLPQGTTAVHSLVGGNEFLAVATNAQTSPLAVWTWNWMTNQFVSSNLGVSFEGGAYASALGEVLLTLDAQRLETVVTLSWFDTASRAWTTASTATLSSLSVDFNAGSAPVWSIGPGVAALCFASQSGTFQVALLTWAADYTLSQTVISQVEGGSLTAEIPDKAAGLPFPPTPVCASGSFVGVRQYLFRFDGAAWNTARFASCTMPLPQGWLQITYGDDFAVQAINTGSSCTASLIAFDANAGSFGQVQQIGATLPAGGSVPHEGWPSAVGGDFLVAQNWLYFRGSDTTWSIVTEDDGGTWQFGAFTNGQGEDMTSLINGSPSFLAVMQLSTTSGQNQVNILPLRNGQAPAALQSAVPATSFSYNSPGPSKQTLAVGDGLSGPSTLVSFPAQYNAFSDAQEFTLTQYAALGMTGPITAYPVTSLTLTHGYEQATGQAPYQTAYLFDAGTATCDPTGMYVKFLRSTSFLGCTDPAEAQMGRTVYSYQNGYVSPEVALILDGKLVQTIRFAGKTCAVANYDASLGLDPLAQPNAPAVPVPQALAAYLNGLAVTDQSGQPVTVGVGATLAYVQAAFGDDGATLATYPYWQVIVAEAVLFNIEFQGDPDDPASGQLYVYLGAQLESTTTEWGVFTQRNVNPTQADAPSPLPLHGGFARPLATTTVKDGVARTVNYAYTPAGFQAPPMPGFNQKSWTLTNALGQVETHTDWVTSVAAAYPAAGAGLNLLQPTANLRHEVTVGGATSTTSSYTSTWDGFTQTTAPGVTVLAKASDWNWSGDPSGSDTGLFPFNGAPDGDFWIRTRQVTAVRDDGLITDETDASGVTTATSWDREGTAALARLVDASFSQGQALFTSFDPIEDLSGWTFAGGAAPSGSGQTSYGALQLPVGGTATVVLAAPDTTRQMMLIASVRTAEGYAANTSSGWTASLSDQGGGVGAPVFLAFPATAGAWIQYSAVIDLPGLAGGTTGTRLTLQAANPDGGSAVTVDNLILYPLGAGFTGNVYDPSWRSTLARLNASGRASPVPRDAFQRETGLTSESGTLQGLMLRYPSLLGNPAGFAPADPNAVTRIRALQAGSLQLFLDDSWAGSWTPAPTSGATAGGGVLSFGATATTLTSTAIPTAGDMAVHFECVSQTGSALALTQPLSVGLGDASIQFTQQGGSLTCALSVTGEPSLDTSATLPAPLQTVLVAQTFGQLIVWVNGCPLINASGTFAGAPVIDSGGNQIGLRNLALLDGISTKVVYSDATGADRQVHLLTADDYLLQQILRDDAGREIIRTKNAPGAFGGGAAVTIPAYRPSFVDVGSTLAALDQTGAMTGDVADWYAAGTPNVSDDEGYPYTRTIFEAAEKGRTVEQGYPGKANAIIAFGSSTPETRPTFKYAYGNESTIQVPAALGLPVGQWNAGLYRLTAATDPAGNTVSHIQNSDDSPIGRFASGDTSTSPSLVSVTYSPATLTTVSYQPNYYALGNPGFVRTDIRNPLGQLVSTTTPDSGETVYLYDTTGRCRVVQDADAAAAGTATYLTWDAQGRKRSRGMVTAASLDGLSQALADPLWPEDQSAVPYQRQRMWTWDGDGSVLDALGRLVGTSTVTAQSDGGTTVSRSYAYDDDGQVIQQGLTVDPPSASSVSLELSMTRDNAGRVVSLVYPGGLGTVGYDYDGLDRITAVTLGGTSLASYTYNAQGGAVTEGRAAGAGVALTRSFDSLDREVALEVTGNGNLSFSQQTTWAPDGLLTGLTETATADDPMPAGMNAEIGYGYDPVWRLNTATDGRGFRNVTLSFTGSDGVDQNGNIQSASGSGNTTTIAYAAGTNTVSSAAGSAGTARYATTPSGLTGSIAGPDGTMSFSYIPGTSQVAGAVAADGTAIAYAIDDNGRRVSRSVNGGQPSVLLTSDDGNLVATLDGAGNATGWVQAPGGMVAMLSGGGSWSVVCDSTQTPRLVFDGSGSLVASYAYDSLGNLVASQEPSAGFMPLGFNGRIWDATLGLYDFGPRFYDPLLGRYLVPDPSEQHPSPYVFASNLPNVLIDPSGLSTSPWEVAGGIALFAVAAGLTVVTGGLALGAGSLLGGAIIGGVGGAVSGAVDGVGSYLISGGRGSLGQDVASGALGGVVSGAVSGGATFALGDAALAADRLAAQRLPTVATGDAETGIELPLRGGQAQQPVAGPQPEVVQAGRTAAILKATAWNTLGSAGSAAVKKIYSNLESGQSAGSGLLKSVGWGAAIGFGSGLVSATVTYSAAGVTLKNAGIVSAKSGFNPWKIGILGFARNMGAAGGVLIVTSYVKARLDDDAS